MFVHKANPLFTVEIENRPDASARSVGVKSNVAEETTTAEPGGKLHRWVAVSFGLLCVLQAVLNISLRLALSSPDTDAKNLTEERDNLTSINFGLEERIKNLTEEREEMMRKLHDFAHYSNQGWLYFNGSFYYISLMKKNWQNSRDDCLQRGADLMIVNSYEEQQFTRQSRNNELMWIGLTDRETEGRWKWVDGTLVTTSFWETGEPNNVNANEHCGEVKFSGITSVWNDVPCDRKNFWICEKITGL